MEEWHEEVGKARSFQCYQIKVSKVQPSSVMEETLWLSCGNPGEMSEIKCRTLSPTFTYSLSMEKKKEKKGDSPAFGPNLGQGHVQCTSAPHVTSDFPYFPACQAI